VVSRYGSVGFNNDEFMDSLDSRNWKQALTVLFASGDSSINYCQQMVIVIKIRHAMKQMKKYNCYAELRMGYYTTTRRTQPKLKVPMR